MGGKSCFLQVPPNLHAYNLPTTGPSQQRHVKRHRDQRPRAEIDLGGFAGLEMQPEGYVRRCHRRELLEEPMDGGVTPGVAVATDQRRMNGRPLDAFLPLGRDLHSPGFQAGYALAP